MVPAQGNAALIAELDELHDFLSKQAAAEERLRFALGEAWPSYPHRRALERVYGPDFVSSSRFEGLQLKTFFKDCRNLGLTYDVGECTGTAFQTIDTLSAGVLSIFSAGFIMVDAMKEASRTLSVLAKRFGQNVSRGGSNDSESFHRVYSTLRFIADKLRTPVQQDLEYE